VDERHQREDNGRNCGEWFDGGLPLVCALDGHFFVLAPAIKS
jgi:hypothetical protein